MAPFVLVAPQVEQTYNAVDKELGCFSRNNMPVTYTFKHGVGIDTAFGVCIQNDAELWDFSPQQILEILQEAKVMLKFARDLERIEWLRRNGDERMPFELLEVLPDGENILQAMQEIDINPLATEDEKSYSRKFLDGLQIDKAKKGLRRAPLNTLRQRIIQRDKSKCRYCGKIVSDEIHIDHVVPYSLGGKTEIDNLVVACSSCNLRKGGRTLEETGMRLINSQDV
jgi:hypothetical protein